MFDRNGEISSSKSCTQSSFFFNPNQLGTKALWVALSQAKFNSLLQTKPQESLPS